MKAAVSTIRATAEPMAPAAVAGKNWVAVYADLFKARLTFLVLLTTLVGFYLGASVPVDYLLMTHTVLATAFLASGAAALNQLWERRYDARMRRTQDRPLPSGRLQPATVFRVGAALSVAGVVYLAAAVNAITAVIGALCLLTYLFVYTPLKRITPLNTAVGAVPGALPPLMGWTAAHGALTVPSLALFGIVALWQLPHFMAIAWLYREDYARAGFKMLPVVDPEGRRTGRQSTLSALALVPVSCAPFLFHWTGPLYLASALLLGGLFAVCAVQFQRELTVARARRLFFVSIIYLPILLGMMVWDKIR